MTSPSKGGSKRWDAAAHEALLFAVIKSGIKLDIPAITQIYNPDIKAHAVGEHIRLLKVGFKKEGWGQSGEDGAGSGTPTKKRKAPEPKKAAKKKKMEVESDEDDFEDFKEETFGFESQGGSGQSSKQIELGTKTESSD